MTKCPSIPERMENIERSVIELRTKVDLVTVMCTAILIAVLVKLVT